MAGLYAAGQVHRLTELTSAALDGLDRAKTVLLLVVCPLEQHGPHLPIGTDLMIAEHFASRLGRRLADEGWGVVILPSLSLGAHTLLGVGSVAVGQRALGDCVYDVLASPARQGFRYFAVLLSHGGPGHTVALEEACAAVSRKFRVRAASVVSGILCQFLAGKFGERIAAALDRKDSAAIAEALRYDYHAGLWETSMMLRIRPDLVRGDYRTLEPVIVESLWKVRADSGLKLGKGQGYLGSPALADEAVAHASEVVLEEAVGGVIQGLLSDKPLGKQVHSPYYYLPLFRTGFWRWVAAALVLVAGAVVWFASH